MKQPAPSLARELLRISRPWWLLAGILMYALGAGIAAYLGRPIRWDAYLVGQTCMVLLQWAGGFLRETFDLPPRPPAVPSGGLTRSLTLAVAATLLTIGAVLTVLMFSAGDLPSTAFLMLGLALAVTLVEAVPPFSLHKAGYGELTQAVFLANLVPAFAFVLQTGDLHRLLALITFPITLLMLSTGLAAGLPTYAADIKNSRNTMLVRLGWQRGMNLHNLFILLAYLTLGAGAIAGLPWGIVWPALLGLPIGLFTIYQMFMIAGGAPPRWRTLLISSGATLALTVYFITFALWTG